MYVVDTPDLIGRVMFFNIATSQQKQANNNPVTKKHEDVAKISQHHREVTWALNARGMSVRC